MRAQARAYARESCVCFLSTQLDRKRLDRVHPPRRPCQRALRLIVKAAVAVLALESVAEQITRVRPILNSVPERGEHEALTGPSTASMAETLYLTRERREVFPTRTAFETAPWMTGAVVSNVSPGTASVPDQTSRARSLAFSVPLPETPA